MELLYSLLIIAVMYAFVYVWSVKARKEREQKFNNRWPKAHK